MSPTSPPACPLAVVVINYRTPDMTIECAETVLPELPKGARLVIVENASGDDSAARLAAWAEGLDPRRRNAVTLAISATNDGFSGGNNRGLAAVPDARRYLLLNSDAFARPGAVAAMTRTAEANPAAGLIHPVLIDPDGTHQISRFRSFRLSTELVRGSGLDVIARRARRGVVAIPLDADEAPEWVSFACVMLDGRMVREIGPMDDGYFMYFEDAEYAERARESGWQIVQAKDALVEHRRGGSSPVKALAIAKKRLPRYYYESRSRYYRTRYGRAGLIAANLLWGAGRALGQVRRAAGKTPPRAAEAEARDVWTDAFGPIPHHAAKAPPAPMGPLPPGAHRAPMTSDAHRAPIASDAHPAPSSDTSSESPRHAS